VRACIGLTFACLAVATLLREEAGGRRVFQRTPPRHDVARDVEPIALAEPAAAPEPESAVPEPPPSEPECKATASRRVTRSYDLRAVDAGKVESLRQWIAADAAVTQRATSLDVEASLATHDRIEAFLGSASPANVLRSYPADAVALAADVSRRWPGALVLVNAMGMVVLAPRDVHEALARRLDGLRLRTVLAQLDDISSGGYDRIVRYPSEEEWDAPAQRKRQGTP